MITHEAPPMKMVRDVSTGLAAGLYSDMGLLPTKVTFDPPEMVKSVTPRGVLNAHLGQFTMTMQVGRFITIQRQVTLLEPSLQAGDRKKVRNGRFQGAVVTVVQRKGTQQSLQPDDEVSVVLRISKVDPDDWNPPPEVEAHELSLVYPLKALSDP